MKWTPRSLDVARRYAADRIAYALARFDRWLDEARRVASEKGFFHWQLEFPEVYFDRHSRPLGDEAGFDVVVGNPPYVRQEALGRLKTYFAADYPETYHGVADLYVYFYQQGLRQLRRGGRMESTPAHERRAKAAELERRVPQGWLTRRTTLRRRWLRWVEVERKTIRRLRNPSSQPECTLSHAISDRKEFAEVALRDLNIRRESSVLTVKPGWRLLPLLIKSSPALLYTRESEALEAAAFVSPKLEPAA